MKRTFGHRVNEWLAEPPGEQFVAGKWRFWLVAVVGLSVLNAILTALIFRDDDQQNYISPIMLSVGALLAWLCVGCLHYSDSTDRRLARGVAGLDSLTLLFVVCHFCGLMWAYGHLRTIQGAERKYEAAAAKFNAEAKAVSQDNVEIAKAAQTIAIETRKAERLRNDTAYQQRKAAEAGAKVQTRSSAGGIAPSLSTAPIELERPVRPEQTSAQFLGRWDWLIRVANFGELMLAAVTLVFIRNQSAKTNEPRGNLPLSGGAVRTSAPLPTPAFRDDTVSLKRDDTAERKKATRVVNREGLKRLRETLKETAFEHGPTHFKTDPKPEIGAVWIRQYKSSHGVAREVAAARARVEILDDAMKMAPAAFRERLENFLRENGFEI